MMARQVEKKHFQPVPAAPTRGNLFRPMAEGSDAHGGWQQRHQRQRSGAGAGWAALALLSVPLGLYAWRRARLDSR
jgi:hypothetical protein